MNADDLKKLTTDSLDRLAGLLDAGHSDQLSALLKAMARFHRYSFNNVRAPRHRDQSFRRIVITCSTPS